MPPCEEIPGALRPRLHICSVLFVEFSVYDYEYGGQGIPRISGFSFSFFSFRFSLVFCMGTGPDRFLLTVCNADFLSKTGRLGFEAIFWIPLGPLH
jgi:hypothetical protein